MKLPIAYSLGNREASLDQDSLMRNALAEKDAASGIIRARKRPAIESAFTTSAAIGQGLFTWTIPGALAPTETLVAINGDVLNTAPTAITKALRFVVQPGTEVLNTSFSPAVTVRAVTQSGQTVTTYTSNIVVSLGTNPTGATLGGTLTQAAVSGVATFSNLTLNRSGEGFKLAAAASGLRGATSNSFNLPTKLVFTTQPTSTTPNTTLDPVIVTAQDSSGATDTAYTGVVTVALYANSAGGILSGTATATAVAGVATFSSLEIDEEGTYSLVASGTEVATAYKPASAVSDSFTIGDSFDFTLVAQSSGGGLIGYISGSLGSLTPTTYLGKSVIDISSPDGSPGKLYVEITDATGQSFFTSITVGATTLLSADATTYSSGRWEWDGSPAVITAETSYAVTITP